MINKKYTPISEGKARKIAAQWCESSDRKKIILDGIITSAQQELQYKSSSAKSIKKISKLLADFFSAEEIYKKFFQNTPRKISFEIILAYLIQEEIEFRVMRGEINGRSGGCHLSENTAAKISWHAFTRVLNRNEFENKIESFKEILDSLQIADAWNSAGYSCHAQCWPILSLNGFFVAVPSKVKDVAIFVTWMKSDNLSKKWGVVLDNLKALRLNNPILIKDSIFARKFIGSFPWMLREHLPGVDIHKIAWDSLNIENIDSKSAASVEEGIEFDAEDLYINIDGIKSTKTSDTYIPGLNYQNSRPPFANHSRHCGVVVQKRASGALIISLKDSLYGKIPQISNDRSEELIPGSVNSNIGDELEVEVKKIFFIADESAYLISLDRASLMDKIWNDAKKKYPIHAEISGVIIAQYTNECIVALTDGVRGKVPIETIRWKLANSAVIDESYVGHPINLIVIGYKSQKRIFLFDDPQCKALISSNYRVGQRVSGRVVKSTPNHISIILISGTSAYLSKFNCWNRSLPLDGEEISAIIIYYDQVSQFISLALDPPLGIKALHHAMPKTEEIWNKFIAEYEENKIFLVQVISIEETHYMVATACGVYGILSFKETDWLDVELNTDIAPKIGDVFEAQVIKITKNKHAKFSRRILKSHPVEDKNKSLLIGDEFDGIVSNIVDYGFFIRLPFGIDGLIHKSVVLNDFAPEKGEHIKVRVIKWDAERKKLSLSLCN